MLEICNFLKGVKVEQINKNRQKYDKKGEIGNKVKKKLGNHG